MGNALTDFATGDFATKIIVPVLTAVATTIVTTGLTASKNKREKQENAVLIEVARIISLVRELSDRVSNEVQEQLKGKPTNSFQDSRKQIGSLTNKIEQEIDLLKIFL